MTYNLFGGYTPQQSYGGCPSSPQNSIVWVQGIEGAKAYPVTAGNSVILMDSENSIFYLKSSDPSGMPQPLRIFDYVERKDTTNDIDLSGYVTKKELDEALAKLKPEKEGEKDESVVRASER